MPAEPPRVLTQCQRFYGVLAANSEVVGENLLFKGGTSTVFVEAGLPIASYSRVKQVLEEMGCISVLVKGNAGRKSEWLLHEAPTEEVYRSTTFSWSDTKYQKLIRRIETLEQRVDGLMETRKGWIP